jgi:hypothetical protein
MPLHEEVPGLAAFLAANPLMAVRPSGKKGVVVLKGRFSFCAANTKYGEVGDSFLLTIEVPRTYPQELPVAFETGGRIPRDGKHHVNSNDGSLCLGSPLAQMLVISREPTLASYTRELLIPYLYAVSHKLARGGGFVFDELAHGSSGLLDDYARLFGLERERVPTALRLLGVRKRLANKLLCPCGCNRRLGRCGFNRRMAPFRGLAARSWYRKQHSHLQGLMTLEQRRADVTRIVCQQRQVLASSPHPCTAVSSRHAHNKTPHELQEL